MMTADEKELFRRLVDNVEKLNHTMQVVSHHLAELIVSGQSRGNSLSFDQIERAVAFGVKRGRNDGGAGW